MFTLVLRGADYSVDASNNHRRPLSSFVFRGTYRLRSWDAAYRRAFDRLFTSFCANSMMRLRCAGLALSQIPQIAFGSVGSRVSRFAGSVRSAEASASTVSWV